MGGAILAGLVASGATDIRVTNRTGEKAALYEGLAGVTSSALESAPSGNADAVRGAKVVIVGVKPAMVVDLLGTIAGDLEPDAVVVSEAVELAASLSTDESPAFVNGLLARLLSLKPSLAV